MSIKQGYAGVVAGLLISLMMIGCRPNERNQSAESAPSFPSYSALDSAGPSSTEQAREGVVLFVGTSLTAGQGVAQAEAFPLLIGARIARADLPFRVVNAGLSGETSAGALRRIDWLLRQDFDVLVLETGANDMLRGVDPATTEENIQTILDRVREEHPDARIVLAGMLALPNLGEEYGNRFAAIYPRLAERNQVELVPFLLEGVAGERELNQGDGMHPNPAGHRLVAATVWEVLEPVLREVTESRPASAP